MNKSGIVVLVLLTLFIGYRLGQNSDTSPTSPYSYNPPTYTSAVVDSFDSEDKLEELRTQLEEAKGNAEAAKDSADAAADEARSRYLETGSIEDMTRMNNAEDAASQASDSLDSIETAASNAE